MFQVIGMLAMLSQPLVAAAGALAQASDRQIRTDAAALVDFFGRHAREVRVIKAA